MARKPKEYFRRVAGIMVHAGSTTLPNVRLAYEVDVVEGKQCKTKIEYGRAVFGIPPVNIGHLKTEKQRKEAELTSRPDLFTHIHAAYLLLQDLEMACLIADGKVHESHGQRSTQEHHREAEDRPQPRPRKRSSKPRHQSRRGRR